MRDHNRRNQPMEYILKGPEQSLGRVPPLFGPPYHVVKRISFRKFIPRWPSSKKVSKSELSSLNSSMSANSRIWDELNQSFEEVAVSSGGFRSREHSGSAGDRGSGLRFRPGDPWSREKKVRLIGSPTGCSIAFPIIGLRLGEGGLVC